ncbi:tetratricopeptide repeat protein [bacterium]|nr:tetratricopeptide repeat protein [bacterium]
MKQNKMFLLLFIASGFLLSGCSKSMPSPVILFKDYLARKDVKAEKYDEALGKYYSLLEEDGDRSTTHSNIGVLLDLQQKKDDALKSLQYALKLAEQKNDAQEIFTVRYNLGVYYGALKKVTEALENYQVALDLMPTSNEIKTNIELLIQQQQQDQQKEQQQKDGEQKQNSDGQDKDKNDQNKDDSQDKKNDPKDDEDKDGKDKENQDKDKQNSPKYQPRPFKGDQLSEGDVKKILGELRNQEQKIRANFDKKEKGKTKNNDKDW